MRFKNAQIRFGIAVDPVMPDGPIYMRLGGCGPDGKTTADDPDRGVWYGPCGHWTDDWNQVSTTPFGIPACPLCNCPGFQITYGEWMSGAEGYEKEGHPDYVADLMKRKLAVGEE